MVDALLEAELPRMRADLARLLAIDTSFPPGQGYPEIVAMIESWLAPLGFASQRVRVPDHLWQAEGFGFAGERVNLIARAGNGKPPMNLYVHLDTVPPGPGWSVPPIALTERDGKLLGRGAADMKGTIPCVLAALRVAKAAGIALRFDPVFLGCTDEEAGAYPGIRYLAEQRLIEGPILCLNGGAVPRIYGGSFGSIDLLLRLQGSSGHGSGAHGVTVNAIEAAVPMLTALSALKSEVARITSAAIPPPPGQGPLAARLVLGVINGGVKSSQTPAQLDLIVNRRYAPEEDAEAAIARIEAVARAAIAGSGATLDIHRGGHLAPVVDPDGPNTRDWARAMAHGFGWPIERFARYGSVSSSDMGWARRAGGHEILLGGLSRSDNNVHGADEFTTSEDMLGLARSLLAFLADAHS